MPSQPDVPSSLTRVHDLLEQAESKDVRLYLISRTLKPGLRKSVRAVDKWTYGVAQIDLGADVQEYLLGSVLRGVSSVVDDDDMEFVDYRVIDDTQDRVYRYTPDSERLAFMTAVQSVLTSSLSVPSVQTLDDVEGLWAVSVGLTTDPEWPFFSFSKVDKSRVGTEDKGAKKWFNFSDGALRLASDEVLVLHRRVTAVYADDSFFVLHKGDFETIAGLEAEFQENAVSMLDELEALDVIEGLELIREEVSKSKRTLQRLARIARQKSHNDLDEDRIQRMKALADEYGIPLDVRDGKIHISSRSDIQHVLDLIEDAYLASEQTNRRYLTRVKSRI